MDVASEIKESGTKFIAYKLYSSPKGMAILVGQPCRKAELTKCINQRYNLRNKINDKDASAQHRAVSGRMITDLEMVRNDRRIR